MEPHSGGHAGRRGARVHFTPLSWLYFPLIPSLIMVVVYKFAWETRRKLKEFHSFYHSVPLSVINFHSPWNIWRNWVGRNVRVCVSLRSVSLAVYTVNFFFYLTLSTNLSRQLRGAVCFNPILINLVMNINLFISQFEKYSCYALHGYKVLVSTWKRWK